MESREQACPVLYLQLISHSKRPVPLEAILSYSHPSDSTAISLLFFPKIKRKPFLLKPTMDEHRIQRFQNACKLSFSLLHLSFPIPPCGDRSSYCFQRYAFTNTRIFVNMFFSLAVSMYASNDICWRLFCSLVYKYASFFMVATYALLFGTTSYIVSFLVQKKIIFKRDVVTYVYLKCWSWKIALSAKPS